MGRRGVRVCGRLTRLRSPGLCGRSLLRFGPQFTHLSNREDNFLPIHLSGRLHPVRK